MDARGPLVGRDLELAQLTRAIDRARGGRGGLLLLSGDAGVGKTRLAEAAASASSALVLRGAASASASAPYGPVIAVLRMYLRARPAGLAACGPLREHLALLLPELGEPARSSDRATIFEAIRRAFAEIASEGHALVVLDDLQWSDEATLELLAALAPALRELALVVVCAYRSDGLPRDHRLRWLRNELRRGGGTDELGLAPLSREQTAELLSCLLDGALSPSLVRTLHDRTQGMPFFVEELARALVTSGGVRPGAHGLELVGDGDVPVPDTVRDAVLLSASGLSPQAREAAETAAVAGQSFDLELVGRLSTEAGLAELLANGLISDRDGGRGAFRHALNWEAWYADVPWLRRRALHRQIAEALQADGAPSMEIATHWLGAREASARGSCSCAPRVSPRRCTPIATRPARAARRSSCGRPARTRPPGASSCSNATPAAPSAPAS